MVICHPSLSSFDVQNIGLPMKFPEEQRGERVEMRLPSLCNRNIIMEVASRHFCRRPLVTGMSQVAPTPKRRGWSRAPHGRHPRVCLSVCRSHQACDPLAQSFPKSIPETLVPQNLFLKNSTSDKHIWNDCLFSSPLGDLQCAPANEMY